MGCLFLTVTASCGVAPPDAPDVEFIDGQPVARSATPPAEPVSMPVSATAAAVPMQDAPAPAPGVPQDTGVAGSSGASAPASAGSAADDLGRAGAPQVENPTKLVTFSVTTTEIGGTYEPVNVGAVWVQDSSGTLVKTLELWTKHRLRYLTYYAEARAGAPVDVMTTATFGYHRTHQSMWQVQDRDGNPVPPGPYTLCVEMTEDDGTGERTCLDFDMSGGPQTIMPPDAKGFTQMKLELQ